MYVKGAAFHIMAKVCASLLPVFFEVMHFACFLC